MKNIKFLLLLLCLITLPNVHAQDIQETTNNKAHYKVIFPDIDQYQLKKILPICNNLFQSNGNIKGDEIHIIYFTSAVNITSEMLEKELLDNNYTFKFTLLILNDKTQTYEKQ